MNRRAFTLLELIAASVLIGAMLMHFPGKRRLELALVRQKALLRALNWMRRKAKKPPLVVAPVDPGAGESVQSSDAGPPP